MLSTRRRQLLALGVAVLVAVIVGVIVGVTRGGDDDHQEVWEQKRNSAQADQATSEVCAIINSNQMDAHREKLLAFSLGYSHYRGKPGEVASALFSWSGDQDVTGARKACAR